MNVVVMILLYCNQLEYGKRPLELVNCLHDLPSHLMLADKKPKKISRKIPTQLLKMGIFFFGRTRTVQRFVLEHWVIIYSIICEL